MERCGNVLISLNLSLIHIYKDYDKWTVVEYTIEDIQADLVCTVSAKEDNSEFYLECNFYGDDQMTKTKYDGKEYTVDVYKRQGWNRRMGI